MRGNSVNIFLGLLLTAIILSPVRGMATIYSYMDESGAVHFTNTPDDPRYRPLVRIKPRSNISQYANYGRVYVPKRSYDWQPDPESYDTIIRTAARRFQVDPRLVKAVIKAESNFDYLAVSRKGAVGLMQLMPETASDMQVVDPFDPEENITGGTRYLRKMLGIFDGDLKLSLAAYNAGPNKVLEIGRVPRYRETRRYIRKVLYNYRQFKATSSPHKRWVKFSYDGS